MTAFIFGFGFHNNRYQRIELLTDKFIVVKQHGKHIFRLTLGIK